MRSLIASLLLWASIAGSVSAQSVVVIHNDEGGLVRNYLDKYDAMRESGTRIILAGDCVSACSLVLTLPKWQVCALPYARLGFHAASDNIGGPADLKATHEIAVLFYPRVVWKWLHTTRVHYEPALEFFRPCNG